MTTISTRPTSESISSLKEHLNITEPHLRDSSKWITISTMMRDSRFLDRISNDTSRFTIVFNKNIQLKTQT